MDTVRCAREYSLMQARRCSMGVYDMYSSDPATHREEGGLKVFVASMSLWISILYALLTWFSNSRPHPSNLEA